ncbi:hypothetical protein QQ045_020735 [Rhodiola kirilowii]
MDNMNKGSSMLSTGVLLGTSDGHLDPQLARRESHNVRHCTNHHLPHLHARRVALPRPIMLAVMSFNVGVFVAAITDYATGFMIFGSRVFNRSGQLEYDGKSADLPPFTC